LRDWLDRNDLGGQWERLGGPLRASGLLLGGLILIKLYEALLDTLDDIPLLPRLLQLAGLLYLLNFGFTHLIKSQDRENLYQGWKKRWHDFTGRP
jgi:threonine/homoserine/homoserine lactone efflux protein